jgi:phi LC3 family holin
MIPAVILLVTQVCKLFGLNLDLGGISSSLLDIVSTVFIILTILGIVNDPTTNGISDSDLAMTYKEPKR